MPYTSIDRKELPDNKLLNKSYRVGKKQSADDRELLKSRWRYTATFVKNKPMKDASIEDMGFAVGDYVMNNEAVYKIVKDERPRHDACSGIVERQSKWSKGRSYRETIWFDPVTGDIIPWSALNGRIKLRRVFSFAPLQKKKKTNKSISYMAFSRYKKTSILELCVAHKDLTTFIQSVAEEAKGGNEL